MPPVTSVTIVFDNNVTKVEIYADSNRTSLNATITTSGSSYNIIPQSTYYPKVYMSDGYIIDNVVSSYVTAIPTGDIIRNITNDTFDFVETQTGDTITITSKKATSQVSIDLTSLSGWGNVTDGEHNIQVVAKADGYRDSEKSTGVSFTKSSATVTLSAGTYRFNEEIAFEANVLYDENIVGKCNTLTDNNTYGEMVEFNNIYANSDDVNYELGIIIDDVKEIRYSTTRDYRWFYYIAGEDTSSSFEYHATDTTKLRTITIETDQQVSQEFKTWFDNNTTLQPAFTQVAVTLTNPFSSYISMNASNAPFGRISNMDKTKTYSIQLTIDYYKNDITYLTYNGTQWVANGTLINIKNQTETSIDLYKGISGGVTDSLFNVIALEGTTQASVSDFTGYTGTETMPDYICLIEGTLVTLANGKTKPIEEITYDDELLVWNFYDGKFDKAKPCWVTKPQIAHEYNLCKFSNGVEIGFVGQGGDIGYHRIYNDELKTFTHTGVKETPIGTHTFAQDGSKPTLIEQHIVNKQVRYYNVGTEKHINIFTNGILTSSRISNKYAIKDMKYIGNRLISEQEEKEYINKKLERC